MNEQMLNDMMRTMITMSLVGTIVSLFFFIIKPFIKDRLSKSFQYYTWLVIVIGFLVPFSRFVTLPVNTQNTAFKTVNETVEQYVITAEEEKDRQSNAQIQYGAITPDSTQVTSPIATGMTVLFILWSAGFFIYLAINLFGYFLFTQKLKRHCTTAGDKDHAMLSALLGRRHPPSLYRSGMAPMPMLVGLLRPAIILPDRDYTEAQLRNVLLHELTHLQRHDIFIKWLAVIANGLHWFNPVIYFVRREINRMCELSCDEAVIKNLDDDGRQAYGDTLIAVASERKLSKAVLSTTMSEEKKALKERLGAIMKSKKLTRKEIIFSAVLFMAVLFATVFLGASAVKGDPLPWDGIPQKTDWPVRDMTYDRITFGSDRELIVYRFGGEPDSEETLSDGSRVLKYQLQVEHATEEAPEPVVYYSEVAFYLDHPQSEEKGVYRIDVYGNCEMTGREAGDGTLSGVLAQYGGPNAVERTGDGYIIWYYSPVNINQRMWFEVKDGELTMHMGIVWLFKRNETGIPSL